MKPSRSLLTVLFAAGIGLCPAFAQDAATPLAARPAESAGRAPAAEIDQAPKTKMTFFQLQRELMDFADRYMQMIGQAVDAIQRANADPAKRAGIHSMKLFPASAAFDIATDADPQMGLLDMVVLVRLQGDVWRETLPKRFGKDAESFLAVQTGLEEDVDGLAVRALGGTQLEKLKSLIGEWRRDHPDQRYVSYIRFEDFAQMARDGRRPSSGPSLSIAGLLSAFKLVNVDEASRSVDSARMLGERAMYLSQRMPTLLRWQSQMFFYEMASTPEARDMMETVRALREFPRRLTLGLLTVLAAAFALALLYRFLSKKIG